MLIVLKSQFHNFETIFLKTRRVLPAVHKIQFECQFFDELPPTKSSATLLYCHIKAFEFFGGIPDEILYDNMKTAWYYDGEHWQTNRQLARFAYHYGFIPKRCKIHRPETKGKVERFNQYFENSFFVDYDNRTL